MNPQAKIEIVSNQDTPQSLGVHTDLSTTSLITSISQNQDLITALNGLTNLNSKEMLEVLQEVVQIASGKDGFNALLTLYNNEDISKGISRLMLMMLWGMERRIIGL
ncbi:hypothetical protein BBW65_05715 [Helicobacter enhydrae]|uniref:Uncharacterized protein n=1 Tax=Helicobacter enhydrae TaxID=222136 RepID=A0A1B1U6G0_9HELI|nr:hypothetical protein [Helicobacter enhydrae]ANV98326.1 hypothetical protein BBW65_05715 [Helicobacter enhydrae]